MVHSCDYCDGEFDTDEPVLLVMIGRCGVSPRSGNPTFLEDRGETPSYFHQDCLFDYLLQENEDLLDSLRESLREELEEELLG